MIAGLILMCSFHTLFGAYTLWHAWKHDRLDLLEIHS